MIASKPATWLAFRDVVHSSLMRSVAPSASVHNFHLHSLRSRGSLPPRPSVTRHFHNIVPRSNTQKGSLDNDGPTAARESVDRGGNRNKRKPSNKRPLDSGTSLRKVAVQAQFSRQSLIKGSGKLQYIDPDVPTKDITAYCAADIYDLRLARGELEREGYQLDPVRTGLGDQVLHFQTPNYLTRHEETGEEKAQGAGDVFVFPSGCVVTWNVPDHLSRTIVTRFLPSAAGRTGHLERMEAEDMEYIEDERMEKSQVIGDTILLGTKQTSNSSEDGTRNKAAIDIAAGGMEQTREPGADIDTILTKIAFSSALARSTKLAVLEESLSAYFISTRSIPSTLSTGRPIRITRRHILRKTGELLSIRAQLNLYSELTDSLPDLFWDSRHELGLEGYYDILGRSLDVGVRIKVLNEKMDYAGEIAAVLRERLSEKHSAMLEWMIIGLICIEVGFGIVHLVREKTEMEEMRRTRELAEQWLERQLMSDLDKK